MGVNESLLVFLLRNQKEAESRLVLLLTHAEVLKNVRVIYTFQGLSFSSPAQFFQVLLCSHYSSFPPMNADLLKKFPDETGAETSWWRFWRSCSRGPTPRCGVP